MMPNAVAYVRVSTTKQDMKDLSVPDQIQQITAWCSRENYSLVKIYREKGASGTDDRRPAFKQMFADITDGTVKCDAVIVHSLSRFFRDHLQLGLHERRLKKHSIRLISITQVTSEDSAGEMARSIFSLFDEYSSKENSKHTLRAMKKNAELGYFNGSRVPYGYKTVETELPGRNTKKKKLVICDEEAGVVKQIFRLYIEENLGIKGVAAKLNSEGIKRRGKQWSTSTITDLLNNEIYINNAYFNKRNSETGAERPRNEWVKIDVEPIIGVALFEKVAKLRTFRSPQVINPKKLDVPTLLTGLLRCGHCGSAMTLMTGKGYRYYRCTAKANKHKNACTSSAIRMDKLDTLILEAIAAEVCN